MFTGIVTDLGRVAAVDATADGVRLRVATSLAADLGPGDSVAVNGCCLTAVGESTAPDGGGPGSFAAEVINESLRRTSLERVATPGARVNLELAMALGERFGGHLVQGHVDGTARVVEIRPDGFSRVIVLEPDDPVVLRYVVEKGAIALDGVSLTVSALDARRLEVFLIPETLERTTLGGVGPGDPVNVEVDILAKHVEKLLEKDRA